MELVDTQVLGTCAARCEGSSPFRPTNYILEFEGMNIKEVNSKKLYKEYSLEIPYEELSKKIDEKIQSLLPTVSISGFRKGKAPINIVRKKYEDSVINEVLQVLVNSKTSNLIKEKNLTLFRQPKIDLKNFEKNKPLVIDLKIDLQPKINLKDFSKITLNKYEIDLNKKTIDEQFNKFISSQKSYKKINTNRAIKKSDRVLVNLETQDKKIPDYLKSQKNLHVDTNNDQEILPGLNKKLISNKLKEGDKSDLFFDLSEVLKDKSAKKIEFKIDILSIEENIKFELNDEFLKKNGFKDEADLKKFLKNNLTQQYEQGIKQIEKKQLMDYLDENYNFDLPEGVLEEDFKEIWHRLEHAKKDGSLDEDDKLLSEDALKKRYKKISERRVKLGVLMQHIAKVENITISENDLSKGIMQYASQYPGQEKQIMDYLKNNPSSVESIRGPLLEQKVIDTIKTKSKIKNTKISDDQYKKLEVETFNIKKENA